MKTPSQIKAEIARLEKLASTYPENGRTSFKISIRTLKWVLDDESHKVFDAEEQMIKDAWNVHLKNGNRSNDSFESFREKLKRL